MSLSRGAKAADPAMQFPDIASISPSGTCVCHFLNFLFRSHKDESNMILNFDTSSICNGSMEKIQKTYIWRMTHYTNIGFILQNGIHCCNGQVHDPNYVNIGHRSLITGRGQSPIAMPPGGVLNDYVPFYFHYKMPMLYHIYEGIVTDYVGTQREIIYLVSTAEQIQNLSIPFIFTDRHAYLQHKTVYNALADLSRLNWSVIKDNSWYKVYTALRKELKQAEFLVYKQLPVNALLGIVCHNEEIANFVLNAVHNTNLSLQVVVRPEYYYP